ncbi:MAG: hypothetical protein Q8847_02625, partial [Sweet potato little leaf phytoplasma]|nr:hypothetical protein [Sweet potato little leaf phytoplasma]
IKNSLNIFIILILFTFNYITLNSKFLLKANTTEETSTADENFWIKLKPYPRRIAHAPKSHLQKQKKQSESSSTKPLKHIHKTDQIKTYSSPRQWRQKLVGFLE